MASTSKEFGGSSKKDNVDPRLDFFSPNFDPLLALRTPGVKPPSVDAKTFDNIAMYESSKNPNRGDESKSANVRTGQKVAIEAGSSSTFQRKWLPHQLPIQSTRNKGRPKDVMYHMENVMGPLSLLTKCKMEHIRLKIWTRHSHGIRGYCLAYLTAFDKHWNLALEDVTEVWERRKKRKIPALETAKEVKSRWKMALPTVIVKESNAKIETCERYVKQMLLRGEHVAFIVLLKEVEKETQKK